MYKKYILNFSCKVIFWKSLCNLQGYDIYHITKTGYVGYL